MEGKVPQPQAGSALVAERLPEVTEEDVRKIL
jgi:hypothetical protein